MQWRWIYKARFLQTQCWAKEARAQTVHDKWFHLYILWKWTDQIYDFRSQDSSPPGRKEGVWLGEVTNGVSESNGNTLFPDLDDNYEALFTDNSLSYAFWFMQFSVFVLQSIKLNVKKNLTTEQLTIILIYTKWYLKITPMSF